MGGKNNGTPFHEDGFGSIDSGHLCLSGYNEVIILRRLDGKARRKAAKILGVTLDRRPNVDQQSNVSDDHGETSEEENMFQWPTNKTIQELEELG